MKIAVTGGSGRIGRFVLRELLEHGHEPVNVDLAAPAERICRTAIADLTDLGEVYGALQGADAVLHLAGVNAPGKLSPEKLFRLNSLSTYHVLEAAAGLGISRVAAASSESIYGWCFARHRFAPQHAPVDESHPLLPQESYGLSKIAGEQAMAMFHRRTGMQAVALRFGHVPLPEEYEWLSRYEGAERFLWSHVDSRDAAAACRLAVEADGLGFEAVNVTADDTCSLVPNEQLAARFYPSLLEFARSGPPHAAWSSNAKAKRLLGWQPTRSWR